MNYFSVFARFGTVLAVIAAGYPAFSRTLPEDLARSIFEELVNINTADSAKNVTAAAEAMAQRLRAAGFPEEDIHIDGDDLHFKNLVVRYRGTGKKQPILLLAHLDVVEALQSDWSMDPFHFVEKDGYFYGRGTVDDKSQAACWIANLILFKQEGFKPDRDIIVALTSGEESGDHNGVDWLLANHRDWIDAGLAFNEGGDGAIRNGKKIANYVQASEKVYFSIELKVTNPGGHSSVPRSDNAIYQLANALVRISAYTFPVKLNEVTRTYFERTGPITQAPLGPAMSAFAKDSTDTKALATLTTDPRANAMLHTTCVPTLLSGGHAENALPQTATAVVNCRVLPEDQPAAVLGTLHDVVNDPAVVMSPVKPPRAGPTSPLTPELMEAVEHVSKRLWPDVPIIPTMSTGATDSRSLREAGMPSYGISGFFLDEEDNREHGRDERLSVDSFYAGREFMYELVKRLSQ